MLQCGMVGVNLMEIIPVSLSITTPSGCITFSSSSECGCYARAFGQQKARSRRRGGLQTPHLWIADASDQIVDFLRVERLWRVVVVVSCVIFIVPLQPHRLENLRVGIDLVIQIHASGPKDPTRPAPQRWRLKPASPCCCSRCSVDGAACRLSVVRLRVGEDPESGPWSERRPPAAAPGGRAGSHSLD